MAYRLLADENVEQATVNYLEKLGHDVTHSTITLSSGLGLMTNRSHGMPGKTIG